MERTGALRQLLTDPQTLPHCLLLSRAVKHEYLPKRATMCSRDQTLSFWVKASHPGKCRVQSLVQLEGSSLMTEPSSSSPSCWRRVAAGAESEMMLEKADVS